MSDIIQIEDTVTVGELADKLGIPVTKLITELMKNGVMATVNEAIDFDTAEIILSELGLEGVSLARSESGSKETVVEKRDRNSSKDGQLRPPVVAVMGHVDHGKTSLLDSIRGASVADKEAGGITQHISAYQISHNSRDITLLDTPGHEAFAALRQHGATLTDLVIIVVAADDGIKPQTVEAIKFAKKAGVKILVAINKIDKPGANINKVKQQLADNEINIEEWGGDTVVMPVSAITKQGIPELLDMILLVADVEDLTADYNAPASGLVIESRMEKGKGPMVTVLVEQGEVKRGDHIVIGQVYGKVRNLETPEGVSIESTGPSSPAKISGLHGLPEFGDEFKVVKSDKEARLTAEKIKKDSARENKSGVSTSGQLMKMLNRHRDVNELLVVAKADVKGSLISVIDSLKSLDTEEVAVRIVGSGVGPINDNDLLLAKSSGAIIYGFHAETPDSIHQAALRDKIDIRLFDIIYNLIDDVKLKMSDLLAPEIVEKDLGRLIVKGVFKTTKTEIICGGEVSKGKLSLPSLARISRDGKALGEVEVVGIKKGPQEVKEAFEGDMCGLQLKTDSKIDLAENDRIDVFSRETVERKL